MSAARRAVAGEQPYFFPVGTQDLFGVLHLPAQPARAGVVLCHALAEEKLWSHRVYVSTARELASRGYAVLRFDTRGEGDSALDFEQATVSTRVDDTRVAVEELRGHLPPGTGIVLLGHRLGGCIALAAAAALAQSVSAVAIWDPVTDGKDYFQQLLRSNLTTQMATQGKVTRNRDALVAGILAGEVIVADGYGLSAAFYSEASELQLATLASAAPQPRLLLEIARAGQTEPSAELAAMCATDPRSRCAVVTEPPFWRETRQFHSRATGLSAATIDWLDALTGAA